MKFTDYTSYLFESENNGFQYYYYIEKKDQIIHVILLNDRQILGYINPWNYNDDWEIVSVAAEKGYGYKMHEAVMDFIYPQWMIPVRNKAIQPELINTYIKFISRPDIETKKIAKDDENFVKISEEYDNWFNRRYRLKNKLNINFDNADYNFVKRAGLKFFEKKYPWKSKTTLD
jgi:hypothetical protein